MRRLNMHLEFEGLLNPNVCTPSVTAPPRHSSLLQVKPSSPQTSPLSIPSNYIDVVEHPLPSLDRWDMDLQVLEHVQTSLGNNA
jgi:hypothetical protein